MKITDVLNKLTPGAARAQLGDKMKELIDKHNSLCDKLDADAGVTDTNYRATLGITPIK